jgi:lysophospholipase L1-like esterase
MTFLNRSQRNTPKIERYLETLNQANAATRFALKPYQTPPDCYTFRKPINMTYGLMAGLLMLLMLTTMQYSFAKTPTRILVYGDSNTWGWLPVNVPEGSARYADAERWPGVLQKALGKAYKVEVDGLPGRTLNADYLKPTATLKAEEFNGENALRLSLATHAPLDLVILMLGTNDIKDDLNRSQSQIETGLTTLIDIIKRDGKGIFTKYPVPKILVVAPPPITTRSYTFEPSMFSPKAQSKSDKLFDWFKQIGNRFNVPVINGSDLIRTDGEDGIHFTAKAHHQLGVKLAKPVRKLLNNNV